MLKFAGAFLSVVRRLPRSRTHRAHFFPSACLLSRVRVLRRQRSYPVSKALIEDAKDNLVLEGPVGGLPITCPVRLIHGYVCSAVGFGSAGKVCVFHFSLVVCCLLLFVLIVCLSRAVDGTMVGR